MNGPNDGPMRRGLAVTLTVFVPDNDWTVDDDELRELAADAGHGIARVVRDAVAEPTDAEWLDAFVGRDIDVRVMTNTYVDRDAADHSPIVRVDGFAYAYEV